MKIKFVLLSFLFILLVSLVYSTPKNIHLSWNGLNSSSTTMVVSWWTTTNTSSQGQVRYGTSSGNYTNTVSKNPTYSSQYSINAQSVRIDNLLPDTQYYYSCGNATDGWSTERTFRTGPAIGSTKSIRIAVTSDVHSYDDRATQVKNKIKAYNPMLAVYSGDLVTNNGELQSEWNDFFTRYDDFISNVPFFSATGNHDVHDSEGFYSNLDLFDWPKNSDGNERWYSFNYGNAHFVCLRLIQDGSTIPVGSAQYNWLENDLKVADSNPNIRWKFVSFHAHPYCNASSSGGHPRNTNILKTVCPLFDKYKVDLVFNGHSHVYERSKKMKNTTTTVDQVVENGPNYDGTKEGTVYVEIGPAGQTARSVVVEFYTAAYKNGLQTYGIIDIDNVNNKLIFNAYGHNTSNNTSSLIETFTITKPPLTPPDYTVICSANPTSITGNGISQSTITATVKDKNGANATGQVTFSVNGSGTLTTPTTVNIVNGIATITLTSTNTPGKAMVTASYLEYSDTVEVTVTAPVIMQSICEWHLNEGSGINAGDSGLSGSTGTITGATWETNGKVGDSALKFDSTDGTDDYISVTDNSSLDITNAITLEAWVYCTDISQDGSTRRVVDKGSTYALGASDKAYFKLYLDGVATEALKTWSISDANVWHHLVGTYDGTAMKLYQDGVNVFERAANGSISTNDSALQIGRQSSGGGRFKGIIDEVKIYSRALSAAEVAEHFNPPPPVDNPPQVALVVPVNNSVVSGIVTISGTANDDNGISKVCFYIDDVIKSTDTTAPFAYSLDTTEYANGTHTIKLIATDTIAQTAVAQITVTIDNAPPPPPVDNPPTVLITSPGTGDTIYGSVSIGVTASDAEGGVTSVAFYIDNVLVSTDTASPYAYILDTTQYSNGTHTIKVVATDTIGQTTIAQVTITIDNIASDNPPQVTITSPTNNSVVSGIITISGTANDAEGGVTSVAFYIDNILKNTDTTAPFAYSLDTTEYANGTHTIKLIATDTIAQTAVAQITVTIDNAVPPPPPPPVDNPPQVALVVPSNNSVVSGIVTISGTANDDNGISKVCFYIDDVIKSTDTTAPFVYTIDTTQYSNGTHIIKVIATDTIGQTANAQITISIDNTLPVITPPPKPVSYLTASSLQDRKIQLNWLRDESDGADITGYNIYMASGSNNMNYTTAMYVVEGGEITTYTIPNFSGPRISVCSKGSGYKRSRRHKREHNRGNGCRGIQLNDVKHKFIKQWNEGIRQQSDIKCRQSA